MDTLRTKVKKQDVISSVNGYKFASGDGAEPRRCCRLCAGDRGLRGFCEPKEGLHQLLYRCFGVVVTPSDCSICETCAAQLKSLEQFRILVEAAFPNIPTEMSFVSTTTTCIARSELETLTIKSPISMTDSQETVKLKPKPKKILKDKKTNLMSVAKKANVACNTCKQRYQMVAPATVPADDFVCSRCKNRSGGKKIEPFMLPVRVNYEKGGCRKKLKLLKDTPVKPLLKKCESVIKYHREPRKYQCSQCTQKFMFPQRLAEHVKYIHKDTLDNICVVCSRKFKTKSNLEKHLKIHTGELYQCEICMKIFRSKHALDTHYAIHIKKNKASGS